MEIKIFDEPLEEFIESLEKLKVSLEKK